MMAEKEYISYEEINSECKKLAYILAGCGFKRIIAVARGGLVPACVLAQFLGIREISSISLASYEGEARSELKCLVPPDIRMDEETLFVDDLYDSGSPYRYLKEKYPRAKIAVLFSKDPAAELDFPAAPKVPGRWLVFPWEFEPIESNSGK